MTKSEICSMVGSDLDGVVYPGVKAEAACYQVLMSTAFLGAMGNSVLVARSGNAGPVSARKETFKLHMMLMGAANMLAMAGGAAIYFNKERYGKPHLT